MSDNPGYGFIPSPSSPKKELPEVPKENLPVVNNYNTIVNNAFKIVVDPEAILYMVLFAILVYLAVRLVSTGLRP